MDINFRVLALVLFGSFFFAPSMAFSLEQPTFREHINVVTRTMLTNFLKNEMNTDISEYVMADIDINTDGHSEFILKKKNCSTKDGFCSHLILAESQEKPILLSVIEAKRIVISNRKTHGINDILAFDDKKNDYEGRRYVWSPLQGRYELKDQMIENK